MPCPVCNAPLVQYRDNGEFGCSQDLSHEVEPETDEPDFGATNALELCETVQEAISSLSFVDDHHQDDDDFDHLVFLAIALDDLVFAASEVRKNVNAYLLARRPMEADQETGELRPVKQAVVVGVPGPVEFPRKSSRTQWRNEDLWNDVVQACRKNEWDAVKVLGEVARPSWRTQALTAIGFTPADYCREVWGEETVRLPSRRIDDRGKAIHEEASDAA